MILSVFSFADQPSKHLLVKYQFKSLAGVFNWVTVSRLSCKLFSIDSGPKSFVNYLHYIYFLLGYRMLFFFLMVSFEKNIQYFKFFDEVKLMFFFYYLSYLCPKKSLLASKLRRISLVKYVLLILFYLPQDKKCYQMVQSDRELFEYLT